MRRRGLRWWLTIEIVFAVLVISLQYLLNNLPPVQTPTPPRDCASLLSLITAVEWNCRDKVQEMISHGLDINAQDRQGETVLMKAARAGHREIVELLLNAHARTDLRANPWRVETALSFAVRARHFQIAGMLAAAAADLNLNYDHYTLLTEAAEKNDLETAELLLSLKADIERKDPDGLTPLLRAAKKYNFAMIKLLLDRGADIEAQDNDGNSALMLVLTYHYEALPYTSDYARDGLLKTSVTEIVRLLIARHADVNHANNLAETPLMFAAANDQPEAVKLLLAKGANVHARSKARITAMMMLNIEHGSSAVFHRLRAAGADVNARDINGCTPLMLAALNGKPNSVKALIEAGADVNAQCYKYAPINLANPEEHGDAFAKFDRNVGGGTAIMFAAAGDYNPADQSPQVIKLLLSAGAEVTARSANGSTPLMWAALGGNLQNVKLLLKAGAPVNDRNNHQVTPLMCAAWGCGEDVVKRLLDAGAQLNDRDEKGRTALDIVTEHYDPFPEVIQLLKHRARKKY